MSERDPSGAVLEKLCNLISTLVENKYYLQAPLYQTFLAAEYGRLGACGEGPRFSSFGREFDATNWGALVRT